jgi:transposase
MRKNIIATKSPGRKEGNRHSDRITIGMDLGDKTSRYCVLDDGGEVIAERSVASTKNGMLRSFAAMKRCRIALEVGTHSPWVSRLLSKLGHEVIVANARQVKLISASSRKDDRLMHRCWPGWHGPIRNCWHRSGTGAKKHRRI